MEVDAPSHPHHPCHLTRTPNAPLLAAPPATHYPLQANQPSSPPPSATTLITLFQCRPQTHRQPMMCNASLSGRGAGTTRPNRAPNPQPTLKRKRTSESGLLKRRQITPQARTHITTVLVRAVSQANWKTYPHSLGVIQLHTWLMPATLRNTFPNPSRRNA